MSKKAQFVLLVIAAVFLCGGVIGFHFVEPGTTWGRAIRWVIMFVMTPGSDFEPTNETSAWFQSVYAGFNFAALTMALSTVIVPPAINLWNSLWDGSGSYRRSQGHIIFGAIDWEKVRSLVEEIQHHTRKTQVALVVVSETLCDIPKDLRRLGVRYVKGSLRQRETCLRAGLNGASAVYACAMDYNDPDVGDGATSAYVELIKRYRPEVIVVAEVVVEDSVDLFPRADHMVTFDPTVLSAVAREVKRRLGDVVCANVSFSSIDEAQDMELRRQLANVGIELCEDGVDVQIALPIDLNDPIKSDIRIHTQVMRADKGIFIPLYLSVESKDLFDGVESALCADKIMAKALVAAAHT